MKFINDTDLLFRLVARYEFRVIPDVLIKIHRHHSGQLTDPVYNSKRAEEYSSLLLKNKNFLNRYSAVRAMHAQKVASLFYLSHKKVKAQQIMANLLKKDLFNVNIWINLFCFELFNQDKNFCRRKLKSYLKKYLN